MQTRQTDPIMTEVHAIRDEFAARFNYDVGAIFRNIREMQETSGRQYVQYPARRIVERIDESHTA